MLDRNFLFEKIVNHVEKQINLVTKFSDREPVGLNDSPEFIRSQVELALSRGLEIDDVINFLLEGDFPPSMEEV